MLLLAAYPGCASVVNLNEGEGFSGRNPVKESGTMSYELSTIEIFGWVLWLLSLGFEHTADKQKKQFIR